MKKKYLKNIVGLTLVEMLIAVVVSSLMMAAMYSTYTIINNSYNQVVDKAKISRSSRDLVELLIRDIRMSGFKYYLGTNELGYPEQSYLEFVGGATSINESHDPIVIVANKLGHNIDGTDPTTNKNDAASDLCCDKIHIVYGHFNEDHINEIHDPPRTFNQPYKRYRITYYAMPRSSKDGKYYGIYKDKETWAQAVGEQDGFWVSDTEFCPECFSRELIRDHLVDMEFIAFNQHGRIIDPPPRPDAPSRKDLYNIRSVDVRLTFRSKKPFYRFDKLDAEGNIIPRLIKGLGDRTSATTDKYLRDSVVVTIHTRNIGQ